MTWVRPKPPAGAGKYVWIAFPGNLADEDPDPASADGWQLGATRIPAKLPNLPGDHPTQQYNLQWHKVCSSVASAAAVDSEILRMHVHER